MSGATCFATTCGSTFASGRSWTRPRATTRRAWARPRRFASTSTGPTSGFRARLVKSPRDREPVLRQEGFEWIDVKAALPLPSDLPLLAIEIEARMTPDEKRMSFGPDLGGTVAWEGLSASLELFAQAVSSDPLGLGRLVFCDIGFEAACGDAWVESHTSFGVEWNKRITVHKEYAWAAGLGVETYELCNGELSLEAWIYASEVGGAFKWDQVVLSLTTEPVESLACTLTAFFAPGRSSEVRLKYALTGSRPVCDPCEHCAPRGTASPRKRALARSVLHGYTRHVVGSFAVAFLESRCLWSSENALLR